MPNDRRKLLLQAGFDDLGQVLAVEGTCLAIRHIADFLRSARNHRRIKFIGNGLELLDHLADLARIRHDRLVGGFFPQIIELGKHLLRRAQKERRLQFRILEALALHENRTVDGILGIEKMDVARRDEHFSKFLRQLRHLEIDAPQILVILDMREFVASHEELIVADGLNLKVVVKARNFQKLLFRLLRDDGADQLARFAGRADDDILAVFLNDVLGKARLTMQIFQMRQRHHLIEIAQAVQVLCQKNDMIRVFLLKILLDKIAFHAVDNLDVELGRRLGCIGKRLYDAVIGDGDGRPAPGSRRLDQRFR